MIFPVARKIHKLYLHLIETWVSSECTNTRVHFRSPRFDLLDFLPSFDRPSSPPRDRLGGGLSLSLLGLRRAGERSRRLSLSLSRLATSSSLPLSLPGGGALPPLGLRSRDSSRNGCWEEGGGACPPAPQWPSLGSWPLRSCIAPRGGPLSPPNVSPPPCCGACCWWGGGKWSPARGG